MFVEDDDVGDAGDGDNAAEEPAEEIKEELGINVLVGDELLTFQHSYSHKKLSFIVHICKYIFYCVCCLYNTINDFFRISFNQLLATILINLKKISSNTAALVKG